MIRLKFLYILSVLLLAGCIKDPSVDVSIEEDPYVDLTLNVPGAGSPQSRALSERDENTIGELDILVFSMDNNGTERYKYRVSIPRDSIAVSALNTNGAIQTFRVRLQRTSEKVRLMVLANASSELQQYISAYGLTENTTTPNEIHQNLVYDATTWTGSQNVSTFKPFPMWGESEYFHVNTALPPSIPSIKLLRSVAKVVVTYDINDETGTPLGYDGTIISSVHLFRARTKGTVAPYYAEGYNVTVPQVPATSTLSSTPYSWSCNLYKDKDDTQKEYRTFAGDVYLAEAPECVEGDHAKATCVVLGIKKNASSPELFYRIDFAENNSYVPVLRNHVYNINILNVYHDGHTTAAQAAAGQSYSIIYDITVNQDNIHEMVWNDHYMLGVSNTNVEVLYTAQSTAFYAYTTHSAGWEASIDQSLYPWMELYSGSGSGQSYVRGTVQVRFLNTATEYREGYVEITAGTLKKQVKITQMEASRVSLVNCKLMSGSTIGFGFPIIAVANQDGTERVKAGDRVRVELLWQDLPDLVDYVCLGAGNNGVTEGIVEPGLTIYTRVNTKDASNKHKEGNIAIAVRNLETNKIIWCWHIWVTDYVETNPSNWVVHNGYVFLDRNLGATSSDPGDPGATGLYYQWGRMNPFPGPAAMTGVNGTRNAKTLYDRNGNIIDPIIIAGTYANDFEDGIANPTTMYAPNWSLSSVYGYPWTKNGMHNNYWTKSTGAKELYDPCPAGWKVADYNSGTRAYQALGPQGTFSSAGAVYENDFIPAAGNRDGETGYFWNVGSQGQLWYANAYHLNFTTGGNVTNPNGMRANLLPVRCMRAR